MKLIPLEEVKKILKRYEHLDMTLWAIDEEIESLPTIDPIALIDAEIAKCSVFVPQDDLSALVKLKSIFLNNQ